MTKRNGIFITFEGSEGSGKSTQINLLKSYLKDLRKDVLFVREPGGVKISEKIRRILLDVQNEGMTAECETLLYMASRSQLVKEVIEPALKKGTVVLCDRFLDSTVAYQGYGGGIDIEFIKRVGQVATLGISPNRTYLFDLEAEVGLSRINRKKDRIELREMAYHNNVRKGYLALSKAEPERIHLIKVDKSKAAIHAIIREDVDRMLGISV